jgi:hypothetical protein
VRLLRDLLLVVAAAGIFGFLTCAFIEGAAERRLANHPEFSRANGERTAKISVKQYEGFVEPDYADRFQRADRYFQLWWLLIAVGSAGWSAANYAEKRKEE